MKPALSRKKSTDVIRLLLPVFSDRDSGGEALSVSFDSIKNGACLYGDIAKKEGMRSALLYADQNRKDIHVAELVLSLGGKKTAGIVRLDEESLLSGDYGMVRFEKYAVKVNFYDQISQMIIESALKKYPNYPNSGALSAEEWLIFDPSILRPLFDKFPVDIIIASTKTYYSAEPVLTAVIRDISCIRSVSLIYSPDTPITIVQ